MEMCSVNSLVSQIEITILNPHSRVLTSHSYKSIILRWKCEAGQRIGVHEPFVIFYLYVMLVVEADLR